jgi:hypothetical protein
MKDVSPRRGAPLSVALPLTYTQILPLKLFSQVCLGFEFVARSEILQFIEV